MQKKLKKVATLGALGLLFLAPQIAGAADYTQEQLLQEFEYLKQKVQSQQEHIEQLQSVVNETMDKKIDAKVEEKIAKGAGGKVTLGNKFIDQLDVLGDLRVRYERRDVDGGTARDRFRTRVRVGGVWKNKAESWEVGAGLATGGNGGTSTNDTWGESDIFETGDIRLDYAYAKHRMNDFSFIAGQQKNPFVASWLIWDSDLRPTGFTGNYTHDSGLFATAGAYALELINSDNTSMLYAGQVGYANKIGDVKLKVAAGYQHYDSVFSSSNAPNPDYDFQIGDLYAQADFTFDKLTLSPYAQVWMNFGADGNVSQAGNGLNPKDEDLGWLAGIDAKMGKFKLGYAYAVVGADSIVAGLKDADFGDGAGAGGVDVKGHRISASYSLTKNMSADFTAMLYESDARSVDQKVDLYQFDINYKF